MIVYKTESFEVENCSPQEAIELVKEGVAKSTGMISYRVTSSPSDKSQSNFHTSMRLLPPGTVFSRLIKKVTGEQPCPVKCRERVQLMNQWGWWKCWRERKTIAGWIAEEARKRGHAIDESNALEILMAAFKELRKQKPTPDGKLHILNG